MLSALLHIKCHHHQKSNILNVYHIIIINNQQLYFHWKVKYTLSLSSPSSCSWHRFVYLSLVFPLLLYICLYIYNNISTLFELQMFKMQQLWMLFCMIFSIQTNIYIKYTYLMLKIYLNIKDIWMFVWMNDICFFCYLAWIIRH